LVSGLVRRRFAVISLVAALVLVGTLAIALLIGDDSESGVVEPAPTPSDSGFRSRSSIR
jgi:hypothetical protein